MHFEKSYTKMMPIREDSMNHWT